MSEQTAEATETGAEVTTQEASPTALPDDHPLVRTLAEQKKAIKELKAKAQRLDEIEEASKSEAEKQAERLKALEAEATSARAEALRLRVAAKFGISDEHADLFLTGSDEASLTKQAEAVQALREDRKKTGNHVAREGTTSSAVDNDERTVVRELFAG